MNLKLSVPKGVDIDSVSFSLPFFTTAAAVSSQELSIAKINTSSISILISAYTLFYRGCKLES